MTHSLTMSDLILATPRLQAEMQQQAPVLPEADQPELNTEQISRIIEMAWEDRTPFDAIERLYGLNESAVIRLMRSEMKASSFKMWRKRVTGRKTKHIALREEGVIRAHAPAQYKPR